MIFPDQEHELEERVRWLVDKNLATRDDREQTARRRERYFLWGSAENEGVRYNNIEPHIDLVASFLYSPDHAFYNIAASRNAPDAVVRQAIALQDEFNDDYQDSGLSNNFAESITWSCVYNTMIVKQGWNDIRNDMFGKLVAPYEFGVFDEYETDLDNQEAFTHSYHIPYHEAVMRLVRAGRARDIADLKTTQTHSESPFPELLTKMIISATGGTNLQGNIIGQVNPNYLPTDTYNAQTEHPMVRFEETWAWDSEANDYRIFHSLQGGTLIGDSKRTIAAMMQVPQKREKLETNGRIARAFARAFGRKNGVARNATNEDDIVVSSTNLFLPGEHSFTKVQPYPKWNYFWGKAHIDALIPLQDWLNERLEQIDDILERQAYPPKTGMGLSGLPDEKFAAWGAADTFVMDPMPGAKVEEFAPDMPPDIFAEVKEIRQLFLEASGLTEVVAGRGESGVRSRQHARELQKTGSGRIKRAALNLEPALVRLGDIGLKLKIRNDEEPITPEPDENGKSDKFLPAQLATEVKIRIEGHSHSPLFGDETRELAVLLKKSNAIDDEMFVRMTNPPQRDNIIHALRLRARRQQQMMARMPPEQRAQMLAGGGGRRRR